MKPETLPPESEAAAAEPDADFLSATEHVPGEVKEDHRNDFSEMTGGAGRIIDAGAEPGWTVPEVAAVFNGLFPLLVVAKIVSPVGGEHWDIPEEKTLQLGRAFLPIFKKHVPYGEGKDLWHTEVLMWIGALGAIKMVCGDAIRVEIENFRLEKLKAIQKQRSTMAKSTTESTGTGTSPESSSSPANANPERPSSNGASSTLQGIDG
jgi:hypothetical protein